VGIQERKEREKQQRRTDIIDAAEKVFASKGIDATTMDEVAELAELSKGTLYLYFKTKDELYFGVATRGFRVLSGLFDQAVTRASTGIEKIREMGQAYLAFSRDHPHYYAAVTYYGDSDIDWDDNHSSPNGMECHEQGTRTLAYLEQAIEAGMADGSLRKDLNPTLTSLWLWLQLAGTIQFISTRKGDHIVREYGVSSDEVLDESMNLALSAIAA
jgi:AcrR family transcriptional regulator